MPRELSNQPCEVTFNDKISGDKITIHYRMPTTEERIKYVNGFVTRQGNQIVSTIGELRMKAGAKIFVGFKKGSFSVPGKGLISSTPGEENYEPAWKAIVRQYAPDVIEMLALHAFESSLVRNNAPATDQLNILPQTLDDWDDEGAAAPAPGPAPAGEDLETAAEGKAPADVHPLS
jgi:hypothetical protein